MLGYTCLEVPWRWRREQFATGKRNCSSNSGEEFLHGFEQTVWTGSKTSLYAVGDMSAKQLGHHPERIFRDSSLLLQANRGMLPPRSNIFPNDCSTIRLYSSQIMTAHWNALNKLIFCLARCGMSVDFSFWLCVKRGSNLKYTLFVIRNVFWVWGFLVSSDQHLGRYLADQRLVLQYTTASLLIFMIELVSLCTENFLCHWEE